MCPLILQSPSPPGSLSRRVRAYLVLPAARAKWREAWRSLRLVWRRTKRQTPSVHLRSVDQSKSSPVQVQEEGNKLHLLTKNLQSEYKKAFLGFCTHLWKIPNTPTHSFMCNHPSRYICCQPDPELDSTRWKKEMRVSCMPALLLLDFSPIVSRPHQSLHPLRSIVIDLWISW